MHADRAERVGGPAPLVEVPEAGHQAPDHPAEIGRQPGRLRSGLLRLERSEQALVHPRAEQPGRQVAGAAEPEHGRAAGQAAAGDEVDAKADDAADESQDRAQGGDDGVRHHQLVVADDVRGSGRDGGEEEPVHRQHRQGADVERDPGLPGEHHEPGHGHHRRPDQRAVDDDLPPRPAVDEHARERADQRVREIEDGERVHRGDRVGEALRAEERVGGEPRVEYAVPGLADQPAGEQLAEVPLGQHRAQFVAERTACRLLPPKLRSH